MLPGLLVSLAALALVFSLLDVRKFWQALRQADLRFLLTGVVISVLWLVIRGFVWRTLLQDRVSYQASFFTINEGYLLNNILPFRLGELARSYLMGRKTGLGFWQVIPSILVERALDLAIAAGMFLCTLPFVIGVAWARQAAILTGVAVLIALATIYVLARNRMSVLAWLERSGEKRPFVKKLTGQRVVAFFDGLEILTNSRLFLKALGLEGLNWTVSILQYYLFLWAFFPHPNILWAVFALGAGALGIAAPSSPGSIGVFEAVIVGALAAFGLDASSATAYALSMHAVSYLVTGVLGGIGLYRDGESLSSLYSRLGKMKSEGGAQGQDQ